MTAAITGGPLGPSNRDWKQPESQMGSFLAMQAGELDNFHDNSIFSLALMDGAKTFQYIGESRNDLVGQVTKNNFRIYLSKKLLIINTNKQYIFQIISVLN